MGVEGEEAGLYVGCESGGTRAGIAVESAGLEYTQGSLNSWCSGEMLRYNEDARARGQVTGV